MASFTPPKNRGLRLQNIPFVIDRTISTAFDLIMENVIPDRLRYEIQRHITPPSPTVLDYYSDSKPEPDGAQWHCPDANYAWHYTVDDCGLAEHGDAAYEEAAKHWKRYHEGRWPEKKNDE